MIDRLFLDYSVQKLRQAETRVSACLGKVTEEQVWVRGTANENAIGNLVLHLCGNIRQWLLSGVGGAPDRRNRDAEFSERGGKSIPELQEALRSTLDEASRLILTLTPERLTERIQVQQYDVSVLEAVYHVVEHFAGHTGQIIFATKLLTGEDLAFYRHLKAPAHAEKTP